METLPVALDATIEHTAGTPAEIAQKTLEVCGESHLMDMVRQNLDSSAQDYENESHIAAVLPDKNAPEPLPVGVGFEPSTLWSDIATFINHDINSQEFAQVAEMAMIGLHENAEHSGAQAIVNGATEFGRALSRMVSEKTLADFVGGTVKGSEFESQKIDFVYGDSTVQVQTCFANSDGTTGKSASSKMGGDSPPEHIDYYVVLHFDRRTEDNLFGVGVNDLTSGDYSTEGNNVNTVAKNNLHDKID